VGDRFELDDGWVDLARRRVVRDAAGPAELTWLEARLLRYLLDAAGRAVPRDELLQMVWDYSPKTVSRAVDKTVARLRPKLEVDPSHPVHLQTAFGEGYRLAPAEPGDPVAHGPLRAGRAAVEEALRSGRCVALAGTAGIGKSTLAAHLDGVVVDPRSDAVVFPDDGLVALDPCDGLDELLRPGVDAALARAPGLQVVWVARQPPADLPSVWLRPWPLADAADLVAARHPDRGRPWTEAVARRAGGVPGRLPVAAKLEHGASPSELTEAERAWVDILAGSVRGVAAVDVPPAARQRLVAAGAAVAPGGRLQAAPAPDRTPTPAARSRRWARVVDAVADPSWVVREQAEVVATAREALRDEAWDVAVPLVCAHVDAWSRDLRLTAEAVLEQLPEAHPQAARLWVRCRLPALQQRFGDDLADTLARWADTGPADVRCLAARRLGGLANGRGDDDEARRWLLQAHEAAPDAHLRIGGVLPLAAKVADVDPDRAAALLAAARTEAAALGLWPRVAQLVAVHAGIRDDQGASAEAVAAWDGIIGVLDRAGNDRVLHYYVARSLLASDAPAEAVAPWQAQAARRDNPHGQAFLTVAAAWAGAATPAHVAAHGVTFATELAVLDAAFTTWADGDDPAPQLRRGPVVSRQGVRAAAVLRSASPRDAAGLRAAFPAVPSAPLWRWWRRLSGEG